MRPSNHPEPDMSDVKRYRLSYKYGVVSANGDLQHSPDCSEPMVRAQDYDALKARSEELEGALNSIATNTCCASCQEAALVARAAIAKARGETA